MKNIAATLLSIVISISLSAQQAGDLDLTFGGDGKVEYNMTSHHRGVGLAIQPDQKIVRAGTGPHPTLTTCVTLVRYMPDGSLDTSFGTDGVAQGDMTVEVYLWNQNNVLEIQPDGKLLYASATTIDNSTAFYISRFNSDGSIDTEFGDNGTAIHQIFPYGPEFCNSMTLQPDGKIIVVGQAHTQTGALGQMAAIRLLPNGDLDLTFAYDGKFLYDLASGADRIMDVALQSNGKIIFTGNAGHQGYSTMTVMRVTEDGILDETFATEGIFEYSTTNAGNEYANAVCIGADDEIYIACETHQPPNRSDIAAMKLTPDGELDASFGEGGIHELHLGNDWDYAEDILIDEQGRILMSCTHYTHDYFEGLVIRFLPDGELDNSFGDNGIASVGGSLIYAENIRLQADGKIVVGAWDRVPASSHTYYQTIRVLAEGTVDVKENTINQFVLYPNPASDNLIIQTNSNAPISVELFNAQGMLLEKIQNQRSIAVSHLPSGVYFLSILSPEGNRTYRFVKE